mgnify:FL=1
MKKFIFLCTVFFFAGLKYGLAQDSLYRLSTHILDVTRGIPASDVRVELFKFNPETNEWQLQKAEKTAKNGRIANFVSAEGSDNGIYKLRFYTAPYFKSQNLKSVYPYIEIVFEMTGNGHYHIPLTVSANGYSTYKGN